MGGTAQGISVAVPASWVEVNLAKETVESAAKKLGARGLSTSTLVKDFESLQKWHAVTVFDVKSALSSPHHFARNLNAYCNTSGVTDVGSAGLQLLREVTAAEFKKIATHVTQKDVKVGGVPGVEISYQISSSGAGTIYGSQVEVLPKPDKICVVTLTVGTGQSAGSILNVAATTAQFP